MPSTLAQLRALLRQDLRDEDPTSYLWPDPILNRHLSRSLVGVSRAAPAIVSLSKTMPASRRLDLSADFPASFLWIDAVEYPPDQFPPRHFNFRTDPGPQLLFLSPDLPPAGAQIAVWYARGYTVAEASSDLPAELDDVVLLGARACALADQAVDTTDKLTPRDTPEAYRKLAADAVDRYEDALALLRARFSSPRWRPFWQLV